MPRLTRHDAALRIADLQRSVARLRDLHNGEVEGSKGSQPRRSWKEWSRNRSGRLYELAHLEKLVTELAAGLQAVHAEPELAGPRDTTATALAAALPSASGNRAKVLDALTLRLGDGSVSRDWGRTDVGISEKTRLPPNTVRPRRGELVAQGWIEDSGERRDHNGRPHIVWRLTEAGRMRLQNGETDT